MCMKDWQLGQFIRTRTTRFTTSSSSQMIVDRDRERVLLAFWGEAPLGERITFTIDEPAIDGQAGLVFLGGGTASSDFEKQFTTRTDGDLSMRRWFVISQDTDAQIYVVEGYLPATVVSVQLKDLT